MMSGKKPPSRGIEEAPETRRNKRGPPHQSDKRREVSLSSVDAPLKNKNRGTYTEDRPARCCVAVLSHRTRESVPSKVRGGRA